MAEVPDLAIHLREPVAGDQGDRPALRPVPTAADNQARSVDLIVFRSPQTLGQVPLDATVVEVMRPETPAVSSVRWSAMDVAAWAKNVSRGLIDGYRRRAAPNPDHSRSHLS